MLKKLILASALMAAGSAYAQENTDISGANFQSGKADAALAALGKQAAASGSRLVITAPAEWHAKIAAKVKAGGNADVVLREGFYENVLVRVESKAAVAAAAPKVAETSKADAEKAKAEAAKAKAEAERVKAEAEKAKAEAELEKSRAEAEKARAEAEAAKARAEAEAAAARAATQAPAAAAPAAVAAAPKAAPADDADAIRARFEKTLNDGRSADGNLSVAALQSGDTLYVDGPVRAVTRREGRRLALYWLDGDIDVRRSELKPLATNRYQVLSAVRGEGTLRKEFAAGAASLTAREPADGSPARTSLEKSLNDGHAISETIEPAKLKSGDVIYVSGDAAAVVRRIGRDIVRFWLVGTLDLQQAGLQADGANKYKVLNDTVH
jgi:chemotaxis protein histidine kinase CheA